MSESVGNDTMGDTAAETLTAKAPSNSASALYDFSVKTIKGEHKRLADYSGQVLLIVNTATECGFTPQYDGLEALYRKFHDQGFEILDFPCNQFAGQAPGTDEELGSFCKLRFGTTFTTFARIDVNGEHADPLYKWLKEQKSGVAGGRIKWNFTKFLVDRQGTVVKRYAPSTTPEAIEADIAGLL
ncbi:glutathione peroxidase [Bifidobacterium sp.]|jgi:glutathione peroxidase|uniref:glutathione peroxidase n=1 Tax=Bifidobacterium sp. TaxID=41200 RepID=UPI0025C19E24|nr:glutathione peroxidase [Bifidobacterium sp.]MCI1635918.1 glutathione peroxidase [Bifidobacterium sp.]